MREDENPSNYHSTERGVFWARGAAVEGLRVHRKHRGLPPPAWEDFLEEVMFQRDPEAQKGLGQGNIVGEGISSSGSSSGKTQGLQSWTMSRLQLVAQFSSGGDKEHSEQGSG